ncbi:MULTISPECIES: hypothetical protein [unclassified Pseudofrankia]|uniref:hypothetical protein n=1 Tax=unclassified Pseudofrankia TaxID=2994372 RepID=UPI0008D99CEF|nr:MULTISPECIES: hypothetical protein [unclassified Pseudofrankia]MDT3439313.1 hypothetical protein [Pseudofrankia sp. BMG5.37]OHV73935.1 hypothetical protein BCD48_32855 [Pseudofrankia sp. BMG5.36]
MPAGTILFHPQLLGHRRREFPEVGERVVAAGQRSGAAPGTVIARWYGASPLHHLHRWDLELRLVTISNEHRPTAPIRADLKRLVRSGVLAHVDVHGGTTYPDGRDETRLHVVVRDDLPAALAAVRGVLAQAPPGVTASLWNGTEEISLSSER